MPRSRTARRALGGLLLAVLLAPSGAAQFYAGLNGGYARLDDTPRYGVGTSFYIPAFDHALDFVGGFDYYYRKWNDGQTEVSTVWAVNLGGHLNLPPLGRILRPYAGVGLSFVGVGKPTRLGLNLTSGTYVKLFVRDLYPFAQISYRIADEFEAVNLLDTVFFSTGIRFAVF